MVEESSMYNIYFTCNHLKTGISSTVKSECHFWEELSKFHISSVPCNMAGSFDCQH